MAVFMHHMSISQDNADTELFFFFVFFLGPYSWYMDVPRLGVKSEI